MRKAKKQAGISTRHKLYVKAKSKNSGITLIALVVTIVILLILAGITIGALTGENGLIKQSQNAKTQTEIAEEKEVLDTATVKAMAKDRYVNLQKENLNNELNKSVGEGKYTSKETSEGIEVTFTNSNRGYLVDSDGNIEALRNPEPTPEDSSLAELSQMKYGVIEVDFLNKKGYEVTTTANEPILKDGMKAVYWAKDASGEIDTENPANNTYEITSDDGNFKKENWYNYTAQSSSTENGGSSRWANAMTSDGSYYVWIPRYSYRIVYFDTEDHENEYRAGTLTEDDALKNGYITGYSDARGIVDKDGKRPTSVSPTTAISVNDKKLRTHPVFDGNTDEGGWDSKLTGIWVMKYEASRNDATVSSTGSGTTPKSVPNVKSWVSTNVSTMFTYAKNAYNNGDTLNTTLNSHMMKNSEWGAIVYLTDSKYGRNGTEITINNNSLLLTGNAGDTISASSSSTTNAYNTELGMKASTTGNIYGIYDISGGAYEYVMGFYQEENGNIHTGQSTSGNSGFNGYLNDGTEKTDGISFPSEKKYYQLYKNTTNSTSNADGGMLGDAIKETNGWNSDHAYFVDSAGPVFGRGGYCKNAGSAGSFYFHLFIGVSDSYFSFRVALAVK